MLEVNYKKNIFLLLELILLLQAFFLFKAGEWWVESRPDDKHQALCTMQEKDSPRPDARHQALCQIKDESSPDARHLALYQVKYESRPDARHIILYQEKEDDPRPDAR